MKQQITRISAHQTAKVIGVAYLFLGFLLIPFVWFTGAPEFGQFPRAVFVLVPVFYGFLGYVMTAIFCVFYNLVASWTGGIEFTLKPEDPMM